MEGAIREIYAEMLQLQQREQEMRDLNGECCWCQRPQQAAVLKTWTSSSGPGDCCNQQYLQCGRCVAGLRGSSSVCKHAEQHPIQQ